MEDNITETNSNSNNENLYFILRTTLGKEKKYLSLIYEVLSKKDQDVVRSIFSPENVKGYVFAEATNLSELVNLIRGLPYNKGVIREPVHFEELVKYFEKEGEKVEIHERDIVEVIAGPFKGDRAKVIRIIEGKNEVVIEPLNAPVPIPITLNIDDLRVVNKEEEN